MVAKNHHAVKSGKRITPIYPYDVFFAVSPEVPLTHKRFVQCKNYGFSNTFTDRFQPCDRSHVVAPFGQIYFLGIVLRKHVCLSIDKVCLYTIRQQSHNIFWWLTHFCFPILYRAKRNIVSCCKFTLRISQLRSHLSYIHIFPSANIIHPMGALCQLYFSGDFIRNWVPHLPQYHQQQQGRRSPVAPAFHPAESVFIWACSRAHASSSAGWIHSASTDAACCLLSSWGWQ